MAPRLVRISPLLCAFRSGPQPTLPCRPVPLRKACQPPNLPYRPASRFSDFRGGGRRPSYNRFNRASRLIDLWRTSPEFRIGVVGAGGGGVAFYIYNLETVPVSNRRRFNCVPEKWERSQAEEMYRATMRQYRNQILPPDHPYSVLVNKVMRRLIPASGLASERWEVRVIAADEMKNAFVLPGGKVFVFSGILPICKDEDGLAAVLGHEISHNVAHHMGERLSRFFFLPLINWGLAATIGLDPGIGNFLINYLIELPGSRAQEREADLLGLLMMAKSCYDPQEAVSFWERMAQAEQFAPPQWASTHPSSKSRIIAIQGLVPNMQQAREASGCGATEGFANEFSKAWRQESSPRQGQRALGMGHQSPNTTEGDGDGDYFF